MLHGIIVKQETNNGTGTSPTHVTIIADKFLFLSSNPQHKSLLTRKVKLSTWDFIKLKRRFSYCYKLGNCFDRITLGMQAFGDHSPSTYGIDEHFGLFPLVPPA